jgi:C_GCAxxG_C_C family probable redox protein
LDGATALRVAGAFGGGIARMGLTCGAATGGMMVIGLKFGQATPGDQAAKQQTYALGGRFAQEFAARHGSIACRDLLGADISDPEQRRALREQGVFDSVCPQLISGAVRLLEELLLQD